jgi:dsRNA-specific ribonuclease
VLSPEMKRKMKMFNFEKLEFLGEALIELSILKKFYHETLIQKKEWHANFFRPSELHRIKKFYGSHAF